MTRTSPKCPHCGNTDSALMEDNGLPRRHGAFTLLCVKPCEPDESSLAGPWNDSDNAPPPYCGMQWEPNAPEYNDDTDEEN